MTPIQTIEFRDHRVWIVDQTLLPFSHQQISLDSVDGLWEAIRSLRIRGAPAIGVAAAFGAWIHLGAVNGRTGHDLWPGLLAAHERLRTARPTAVNLFWALDRVERALMTARNLEAAAFRDRALELALGILDEDSRACERIGEFGASLLHDGMTVITHCNAGGLATVKYGTALAPIYVATARGLNIRVFADETRPLLQGSRLTAFELTRAGIPTTVICDSAAAAVMRTHRVDAVFVGADRVAANGDVANKIGTYGLALSARAHGIPMYVAAPISTIDLSTARGDDIVIEERDAAEVLAPFGQAIGAPDADVYNPAFDVTPAHLITALITDRGLVQPLNESTLSALLRETSPV
ncbi:MAG: S-methyl-5-thioribose-1-phosphate isomerase [Chloroflexota bacterium]